MSAQLLHEALEAMRTARRRIEAAHEEDADGTPLLAQALRALDNAYADTEAALLNTPAKTEGA